MTCRTDDVSARARPGNSESFVFLTCVYNDLFFPLGEVSLWEQFALRSRRRLGHEEKRRKADRNYMTGQKSIASKLEDGHGHTSECAS